MPYDTGWTERDREYHLVRHIGRFQLNVVFSYTNEKWSWYISGGKLSYTQYDTPEKAKWEAEHYLYQECQDVVDVLVGNGEGGE